MWCLRTKVFFFIIIFKEALIAVMLAARVRQEKLARENQETPNGEKVTQQSSEMRRAEESLTFLLCCHSVKHSQHSKLTNVNQLLASNPSL